MRLQVLVYENRQLKESAEFDGPVELGRQRDRDELLFSRKQENGTWRWVIARRDETAVGRNQVRLNPLDDSRVQVVNGSDKQPIRFLDRADLGPAASCEANLPVLIILGPSKTIRVQRAAGAGQMHSLAEATLAPRPADRPSSRFPTLVRPPGVSVSSRDMIAWLHAAMDVLQAAADSADFYERAARAVVDSVALDSARVLLLLESGSWRSIAVQTAPLVDATRLGPPSLSVLERMRQEKKTFWEIPEHDTVISESLAGIETVVAAPILNKDGAVIGALYGERRRSTRGGGAALSELEAMLVELLAYGVAAGLARQEEERKALSARVQLEQFFTPELTRQLILNPAVLAGQEREVTVLQADIRSFSRLAERLGPAESCVLVAEVLEHLTDQILEHRGVVVSYLGDGLLAMWGAPEDQPDHPTLACRAAVAMHRDMPAISARWQARLGEALRLGVGINTGAAWVGNTGSSRRFHYGPLGQTVNLASRVEVTTKLFGVPVLVTGATRQRLGPEHALRRLGLVRVVNVPQPVDLYELHAGEESAAWLRLRDAYETALGHFEAGNFPAALGVLSPLLATPEGQADLPCVKLARRALAQMENPDLVFDPVFLLPAK
jgi:adenylate cyclase